MTREREIAIVKQLVAAAWRSVEICATAGAVAPDRQWSRLIGQLGEDRRHLIVDLIHCLQMHGVPVLDVRRAMANAQVDGVSNTDFGHLRVDLALAERSLEALMTSAVGDMILSDALIELLSVHYLAQRRRLSELEAAADARMSGLCMVPLMPGGLATSGSPV